MITKFISLIQLTPSSKTILTRKDIFTVNKRFLPSDKIVTIAQKVGPQPQTLGVISGSRKLLIPQINPRTHLGLYQPRSTTVLSAPLLYDHRASMNNKIISKPNIKFTSLLENKKIDLLLEEAKTAIDVQKYLEILDDIKVKNLIKTKFSEENLRNILTELQKIEVSSERKQEILYNLQRYLKNNPPTIENAQLFLELWYKNKCEFTALDFKQKSKEVEVSENKINNKDDKNKSLEDKQKIIMEKIDIMSEKMKEDIIKFEKDPTKTKLSDIIQYWSDYLKNRNKALSLHEKEIEIHNKLKTLWDISVPKQEYVLAKLKDKLKILKENSTLPPRITIDIVDCFNITDYNKEIKRITNIIELLQTKSLISENDIKLLTINSSAAIIDAEGTFKLTQETYQSFNENKDSLEFSYTKDKPDMNYILTQIKEKNYFIIKEYKNKPGSLIDIAYLGHKTLVIIDPNTGKKIRIGLLTSTDDKNTFLLDEYQQTNPDINKQDKKQCFRILSNFIIVDENEPLLIDMETTLLLQSKNSDNNDITEILQTNYENKKNIWSDNNYQISYNADKKFLCKIAIIFYKKQLEMLEEHLQSLEKNITGLTEDEVQAKFKQLEEETIKSINDKNFQQYISLLSPEHQQLYKVLTFFQKKQQQETSQKKQQEKKQRMDKMTQDFKNSQEQEKQNQEVKSLTAKEKKELYLAQKKLENISNEQTL